MEGRIQDELRCCLQWWPTSRRANLQKHKLALLFVVQSLSRVWLFETPRTVARQTSLSFTISWSLSKLTSNDSVMPYNHLILCHPLFLLPSIFPSIRVLGVLYWLKYHNKLYHIQNLYKSNIKEYAFQYKRCWFDPSSGIFPGEGNGNPLQYSCLENPMDRGDWWATVHGVAKSRTRLSI